jgi:hypothetical protein
MKGRLVQWEDHSGAYEEAAVIVIACRCSRLDYY